MQDLCLTDLQSLKNDPDPRILDLRLAELLGYDDPRQIRKLIKRSSSELERYGVISTMEITFSNNGLGVAPGTEFWLNEGQILNQNISQKPFQLAH